MAQSFKTMSWKQTAASLIPQLEKRGMQGIYAKTGEEAVQQVLTLMKEGSTVAWGGSETLTECGMMEALKQSSHTLIDRKDAKTPEEEKEIYAKTVCCDYFFMSSNAITLDGQLVNIDGRGNRVACLIHGPEHVIVMAGMNKLVSTVEDGIHRTRTMAAPPNGFRLHLSTPCAKNGICGDCLSKDCMCCEVVITRKSKQNGRIIVVLIGEELGY